MRDFGLVREALGERRLLLTGLAPHLVTPVPFLLPLTPPGVGARRTSAPGSCSTTRMGGRAARPAGTATVAARRRCARGARAAPRPLIGAVQFHDAQEDDARLGGLRGPDRGVRTGSGGDRLRVDGLHRRRGRPGRRRRGPRHCSTAASWASAAGTSSSPAAPATDRRLELATGHAAPRAAAVQGRAPAGAAGAHPDAERAAHAHREEHLLVIPWGATTGSSATPTPSGRRSGAADGQPRGRRVPAGKVNEVLVDPLTADDIAASSPACGRWWPRPAPPTPPGSRREHRLFAVRPGLTAIAGGKYTTYRVMAARRRRPGRSRPGRHGAAGPPPSGSSSWGPMATPGRRRRASASRW